MATFTDRQTDRQMDSKDGRFRFRIFSHFGIGIGIKTLGNVGIGIGIGIKICRNRNQLKNGIGFKTINLAGCSPAECLGALTTILKDYNLQPNLQIILFSKTCK